MIIRPNSRNMNSKLLFAGAAILVAGLLPGCGPSAKEKEIFRVDDSTRVADCLSRPGLVDELKLGTRTPEDKKFIKTAETKFLTGNVRAATEKIEDLAAKYGGYLTYSKLGNHESDFSRTEISLDSVILSRKIVVENFMVLRIPNDKLDSLVRELNKLILFLDYRTVKMDDISFTLLAGQKARATLKGFEERQKKNIGTKAGKLKETTAAEESLLKSKIQSDTLEVENQSLADQVKYCTLTIIIYQKPVLYSETQPQLKTDSFEPNMFVRIGIAISIGWGMFKTMIVFLFEIWWLIVVVAGTVVLYRVIRRRKKV